MAMKISIDISEYELIEALKQTIEDEVKNRFQRTFDEALEERIQGEVDAAVKELSVEKLREKVEDIIAKGWPKTDGYGREIGRHTLGEMVLKYVSKEDYHNPVETQVRDAVNKALNADIGRLLAEAKKRLEGLLNASIDAKLRAAFSDAMKGT